MTSEVKRDGNKGAPRGGARSTTPSPPPEAAAPIVRRRWSPSMPRLPAMPMGYTKLFQAQSRGDIVEMERLLLEEGEYVSPYEGDRMNTPLHVAVRCGHDRAMVELLINNGADLEHQNDKMNTPLHLAMTEKNDEFARILVAAGADLEVKNSANCTPLHMAVLLGSMDMVLLLLERKADVTVRDCDENTPLHMCESGEMARALVKAGADLEARNSDALTPLYHKALCPDDWGDSPLALLLLGAEHELRVQTEIYCVAGFRSVVCETPVELACLDAGNTIVGQLLEGGVGIQRDYLW